MKPSQQILAATAVALTAICPSWAQVKCTMPNQKIIILQTASKCPIDAVKAETMDGKDITPPASERKQVPPPVSAQTGKSTPKPVEHYTVVPRREEYVEPFDTARAICTFIKERKVGLCSIDQESGLYKSPSIRVITDGNTDELRQLCKLLATRSHEISKGSMRSRYWSVKVFSKHDIFTPVASCDV